MKSLLLIVFCTLVTSCAIMDNLRFRGNKQIHKEVKDSIYYEYGEYFSKSTRSQTKVERFQFVSQP
jgi:hypothetical protein